MENNCKNCLKNCSRDCPYWKTLDVKFDLFIENLQNWNLTVVVAEPTKDDPEYCKDLEIFEGVNKRALIEKYKNRTVTHFNVINDCTNGDKLTVIVYIDREG